MSALLRHLPSGVFPGGYSSDHVPEPWPVGAEREVEAHVALYLAETFPETFEVLRAPDPRERPLDPPSLADPHTPADLAVFLTGTAAALVYPIRQGDYDRHLAELWLLESAGANRKTVTDAIRTRAARVRVALEDGPPAPVVPSSERPIDPPPTGATGASTTIEPTSLAPPPPSPPGPVDASAGSTPAGGDGSAPPSTPQTGDASAPSSGDGSTPQGSQG